MPSLLEDSAAEALSSATQAVASPVLIFVLIVSLRLTFCDAVKANGMPSLLDDSAAEAAIMISGPKAVAKSNVDPCVDPVTVLA